jgi:hypothetical protein
MICVAFRTIKLFITLTEKFYFLILMSFTNFLEILTLNFIILLFLILFYLFLKFLDHFFFLKYFFFILSNFFLRKLHHFTNIFVTVIDINFWVFIAILNRTFDNIKAIITLRLFLDCWLTGFADQVVT